jgi:hypothetical protein
MSRMDKRLYVVTVAMEYAVLAVDEDDACSYARQALRDASLSDEDGKAVEAKRQGYVLPDGWDGDTPVYGADDDTTWDEAAEDEQAADVEAKRLADFAARQVPLIE